MTRSDPSVRVSRGFLRPVVPSCEILNAGHKGLLRAVLISEAKRGQ